MENQEDRPTANEIRVERARENNLKNLSVVLPRRKITVISGVSGSGKSTLAYDLIHAESQRRFLESLSPYARHFLHLRQKPKVEEISGLSPALALTQNSGGVPATSTVGTVSEIYSYLRLLFYSCADPYCPDCGLRLEKTGERAGNARGKPTARNKKASPGRYSCPACGSRYPEPEPRTFSFNSAAFRCPYCLGSGERFTLAPAALFSDPDAPLSRWVPEHANAALREKLARSWQRALARNRVSPQVRWAALTRETQDALLSVNPAAPSPANPAEILWAHLNKKNDPSPGNSAFFQFRPQVCPACHGERLGPAGRAYRLRSRRIGELAGIPLDQLRDWITPGQAGLQPRFPQAELLIQEMERRMGTLSQIGLGYLPLNRPAGTLSGGELQRLRLAARLQQRMAGVLYVLDEPSIGLHPVDLNRLLDLLRSIRDQGNTVLIVEHDASVIRLADWIIDLGPGGGVRGGEVMFCGPGADLPRAKNSLTARYLAGERRVPLPARRRPVGRNGLTITGATAHNLKNCDLFLPFGSFSVITGVSGSGKSSLVADTLHPLLRAHVAGQKIPSPLVRDFRVRGRLDQVYFVDQKPVGRTPRSTPATFTGIFDDIRRFFARLPEAQALGLTPAHFSFNVRGGRCGRCQGLGVIRLEMKFLPDAFVTCGTCSGTRYAGDARAVRFRGLSIADILNLSVSESLDLFGNFPMIRRRLQVLEDTGLGYIHLGQPTPTLSGGEQQRLKLASELLASPGARTVYLLDEPTTGLHFAEVEKLCLLLHGMVDHGGTIIAIEHNLDFIKQADYLVDMGPGGGEAGGCILYAGPPDGLPAIPGSKTGSFLRDYLSR